MFLKHKTGVKKDDDDEDDDDDDKDDDDNDDDDDDDDKYPIALEFQHATFSVLIKLKTGYQLDLTESNFHELLYWL